MNIVNFTLVLTVFWIILIFTFLPIGIKFPQKHGTGHADSSPIKSYIGMKLLISFIISFVLTIIYWYIAIKFPNISDYIKGLK